MADTDPIVPDAAPDTTPSAGSLAPADDDIDSLLASFDNRPTNDTAPQPATAAPVQPPHDLLAGGATASPDSLAWMNWALAVEADRQAQRDGRDATVAVQHIRGEIDPAIYSDSMVTAWIKDVAATDQNVVTAWQNRYADPKAYQRTVEKLGFRFAKEHGVHTMLDRHATEDREAVTAAVRGAGGRSPENKPPSYGNMSDTEFRDTIKKQFGFTPGV